MVNTIIVQQDGNTGEHVQKLVAKVEKYKKHFSSTLYFGFLRP